MLTKRIIPCLDVDHGRVVKGKKFKDIQDVADPVELGRYYSEQGADELVFYDITASYEERDIFINIVEKVAEAIRIPFTIGGGISRVEDFRKVLMAGNDSGSWDVYVKGGRENTGIDAIEWAKRGQELGAGEICINSIDTDGVKRGYDLELNRKLSEILTIPVIASGGAGEKAHFSEVLKAGADAALAASVFHYKEIPIPELKAYLAGEGIAVRK